MNKFIRLFGVTVLSGSLLVGCGMVDESVSTGAEDAKAEEKQEKETSSDSKKVKVNKEVEAMGVKIKIGEMKLSPKEIQVGVSMENTSERNRNMFLDMDTTMIIDGTTQVKPNMFMGETLDNEMAGGIKQDGVMVFPLKDNDTIDPNKVKEIELRLPPVQTGDFMKEEKIDPIKIQVK